MRRPRSGRCGAYVDGQLVQQGRPIEQHAQQGQQPVHAQQLQAIVGPVGRIGDIGRGRGRLGL